MADPFRLGLLLGLAVLLPVQASCGTVKRTKKKIVKALEVVDRAERLAQGDTTQVLPIVLLVLNESQDMAVVHQDGTVLVAELRRIPGLGLKIPSSERKRYHLRIDLSAAEQDTALAFAFFRSEPGDYHQREEPDDFISRTAARLFTEVAASLMKAGLVLE